MKFRALIAAAALAAAVSLSGCAGIADFVVDTSASVAGPSSSDVVHKVAQAEVAYTEAARLATVYLNSGQLVTPTQARMIKALDAAVYAEIVAARTAAESGNSVTVSAAYEALRQGLKAFRDYENSIGASP